jgi:hypothetical protein
LAALNLDLAVCELAQQHDPPRVAKADPVQTYEPRALLGFEDQRPR